MSETTRLTLPLLPLANGVVLPQMVVTLALESDEAQRAADAANDGERLLLLVPRVDGRYSRVGTIARVENSGELPNGQRALVLRGLHRAAIGVGVPGTTDALWVEAEPVTEQTGDPARVDELVREYRAVIGAVAQHLGASRFSEALHGVTEPGALADTAGWWPDLSPERRVELLETVDVQARLEMVVSWARDALAELELAAKIRSDVTEGIDKRQREFLLREQMAAIRKELGNDADGDVVSEYRRKLEELDLPERVREAANREVDRLEQTGEQNPEYGWIRTWLDTLFEVPWGTRTEDVESVAAARAVLDADHTGLDDVKDRIVEYLAVRKLRAERGLDGEQDRRGAGAILALVGPPGVGKTSLGESIARALGRKFGRVALGGVRDEAEVRGHRRTYVGARPGRIVRALSEAGSMDPVIVLDEVDKLGADWRGDPSSALLEVLDPAQNHTFRDHYLEVDLDLSDVLFLATANVVDTIPGPLLDRLEVIRLDGYTEDEKVAIGRDHLLARQLRQNGLRPDEVELGDEILRTIVTDYTREAGVRNLERELGKLLRKLAARFASGNAQPPLTVDDAALRDALGRPKFFAEEVAERTAAPGVATGLAVTGTGGDVLFIEATAMDGEPGLVLTGQLGDVMKESAQIALSYVQGHSAALGIDPEATRRRFHVHVPAGAIPKDGPSAGITMTTALASLLSGRPVRGDVGMTGEVTLQGRVLPIGGVKQKVLAAERAGLTTVILPRRNEPDVDDVPERVREHVTFHFVDDVAQVFALALEPPAEQLAA
ncbi:MAG: endopeptidase La [Actinobacteria bacterium]|nr:MAG: endopeptidase La [Actinomycetota bacterium]